MVCLCKPASCWPGGRDPSSNGAGAAGVALRMGKGWKRNPQSHSSSSFCHVGVSIVMGVPQIDGLFQGKSHLEMDDELGVLLFQEASM